MSQTGPGEAAPDGASEFEDTAGRLCGVVARIHAAGWAQGTGGNMSVTLGHAPLRLLITQSGRDKRQLDPRDDLVVVDADARATAEWPGRPSAETRLHIAIAETLGTGSTLHTHSVPGTLLGEHFLPQGGFVLTGYEMLKGLAGVRSHEDEVRVPVLANSQDMVALGSEVRALLRAEEGLHGFLLAGHGLYTWGASLEEAHRHVEIFEFLFECVARRTSFEPFSGN